ncbi:uncharacterized protein [Choristoneura fumiferana]|uniref:uncharacterized protein n=1 Tax=Choristoneura fumiferana TaxID=7141 RepID=UPI003D15D7DF
MPKRKLTNEEKIEHYQRKLRKLRGVSSSSSSSDEDSESDVFLEPEVPTGNETEPIVQENESQSQDPTTAQNETDQDAASVEATPAFDPVIPPTTQENIDAADLDPELLSALGEATDDTPKFGDKIHGNLASLWLPLLRKGLPKDSKDKLLKEYLIPENCTLLQAPRLNAEISAAITEMARNRDKKIETAQQQLGIGITAINRAMTILLTGDDKVKAIKLLSDSCRILSDLHYCETQARTKMIAPGLAKPFLNIIQDTERDEMLFGSKLPEKIKASKVIEKQGLQIKKPVPAAKNTTTLPVSTNPRGNHQYQGNWAGPSRYPSNRGGRGGPKKTATVRKPLPNPSSRPAGQGKPRATQPQ